MLDASRPFGQRLPRSAAGFCSLVLLIKVAWALARVSMGRGGAGPGVLGGHAPSDRCRWRTRAVPSTVSNRAAGFSISPATAPRVDSSLAAVLHAPLQALRRFAPLFLLHSNARTGAREQPQHTRLVVAPRNQVKDGRAPPRSPPPELRPALKRHTIQSRSNGRRRHAARRRLVGYRARVRPRGIAGAASQGRRPRRAA